MQTHKVIPLMNPPRREVYPRQVASQSGAPDTNIGFVQLDLTTLVNEQGVALSNTQMLTQGRDLQVSGDWIAVDSGAVGAVRVSPHSRVSQDDSVLLTPGKIYNRPFHNLRAFYSQNSPSIGSLNPQDTGVYWRAFFGTGPVPFQNVPTIGTGIALAIPGFTTQSPATLVTNLSVREGEVIDISVQARQLTSLAANTSILRSFLTFNFLQGGTSIIFPDVTTYADVLGGAIGTSRAQAKFSKIVIPRGCVTVSFTVSNFGTEATNNIAYDLTGAQLH